MQKRNNTLFTITSNMVLLFFILLFLSFVLILYSLTEADLNERHTNIPLDENEAYEAKYDTYSGTAFLTVSATKRNFPEEISLLSTVQYTTELEQMFNEAEEWVEFTVYAYCYCYKCNGKWGADSPDEAITAIGTIPTPNYTIAADWQYYPVGTQIELDGYGVYTVEDKGGNIKGNKLDMYHDDHETAWDFGKQKIKGRVIASDVK